MAYEPVTATEFARNKGRVRPGMDALMDTILFCFHGCMRNMGIVNVRRQRGGTAISLHAVGRAGDPGPIPGGAKSARPGKSQREIGDELFVRLVAAADACGVCEVIWRRKRWTREKGIRTYYGINPHNDHLHVGMTRAMADSTVPHDQLCKWFAAALFHI